MDSGATHHMTPHSDLFVFRQPASGGVHCGNNSVAPIRGVGSIMFDTDKGPNLAKVDQVFYVPQLGVNLLSVHQLCRLGRAVLFTKHHVEIIDETSGLILARGDAQPNGLYLMTHFFATPSPTGSEFHRLHGLATLKDPTDTERLWHYRLGHLSYDSLYEMSRDHLVDGLPQLTCAKDICCRCQLGKQSRTSFPPHSTS